MRARHILKRNIFKNTKNRDVRVSNRTALCPYDSFLLISTFLQENGNRVLETGAAIFGCNVPSAYGNCVHFVRGLSQRRTVKSGIDFGVGSSRGEEGVEVLSVDAAIVGGVVSRLHAAIVDAAPAVVCIVRASAGGMVAHYGRSKRGQDQEYRKNEEN
ncbi:hypothetical protein L3X38_021092 [Prunus dulcis]|uniref:Uncharacterized protein n=1 Tax=Prunus dulcis TaxID=3755 RepID=A0AAD4Z342_PRUDU|nr:hypothetical protein L3X38_021092 [Prunus dulcis]